MKNKPFGLLKRRTLTKGKYIYYVRFYDENGKRTTAMSTGQTSKSAAETWVVEYLKKGGKPSKQSTFGKYAEDWWIWDRCSYVRGKLARGQHLTKSYCDIRRIYLTKHILPTFANISLQKITPRLVEDWLMGLREKKSELGEPLSPSTLNHCLGTLKIMLGEAARLGYLYGNPSAIIKPLAEYPKKKTILTIDEVKELFREDRIKELWEDNIKQYTLNLLAASTGMRMGEVQGLQIQHVFPNYVFVTNSWERKYGLKGTKTGLNRAIPIPEKTSKYLHVLITSSPYISPEDLVFYGKDARTPIPHKDILNKLYIAFNGIGLSPEERKKRNITFHSWRHFFNTVFRSRISDSKLQQLTGHKSLQMTNHYTHFSIDDFRDVLLIQEDVFH